MPKLSPEHSRVGTSPLGRVEVLPNALHSIAVTATLGCYGVLGIASPRLRFGQPIILAPSRMNQGVQVEVINEHIILDIYVVLEYGLRITEIAQNIKSTVKFSLEKMLGIPVAAVNITVQGLLHSPGQSQGL